MDISNKALAFILVAAIVVSVFGTIFSLQKISQITQGITGFVTNTTTGNATLYINSTTSIKFSTGSIDWGTGSVNASAINCTLSTVGSNSAGCIGFNTVASGLILENDGNVNASVTLNASSAWNVWPVGSSVVQWKVSENEAGSCPGGFSPNTTYVNINSTFPDLPICTALLPTDSTDTLKIDLNVSFPLSAMTGNGGTKLLNITAIAS